MHLRDWRITTSFSNFLCQECYHPYQDDVYYNSDDKQSYENHNDSTITVIIITSLVTRWLDDLGHQGAH